MTRSPGAPAPPDPLGALGGPGALLLTPGAGSDATNPTLVAVEQAVAPLPVARVDFPYRREGRRAPDRAAKLVATVVSEAAALADRADVAASEVVLGGRSMGGRMCSMAVAEGLAAGGLVLLSYPLHPPGRPDRLRTDHFGELAVPCLFVSGTRDPFATPDELETATAGIPGPVTHVWIEGAPHDPRDIVSHARRAEVVEAVASWMVDLGA